MTTYEKLATVIAVMAILQPWIIKMWNQYFKKTSLTFIPSSKIKLYYNRSGTYVYLGGVIEAKNRAAVIKDISVKVIRQRDRAELDLDWSSFMAPAFQSVGGKAITTNEFARPFKVEAGSLYPVFVEFGSTINSEIERLAEIYSILSTEAKRVVGANVPIDKAKQALINSSCYQPFKEELLQGFYWKKDDYCLELSITYNDNASKKYKFNFSIDSDEASKVRENIDKSMQSVIDELYMTPTNFYFPQKEFVLADE